MSRDASIRDKHSIVAYGHRPQVRQRCGDVWKRSRGIQYVLLAEDASGRAELHEVVGDQRGKPHRRLADRRIEERFLKRTRHIDIEHQNLPRCTLLMYGRVSSATSASPHSLHLHTSAGSSGGSHLLAHGEADATVLHKMAPLHLA